MSFIRKSPESLWKRKIIILSLGIIFIILYLIFGNYDNSAFYLLQISQLNLAVLSYNTKIVNIFLNQPNKTHLWSLRLADDDYFRIERLLPCRIVEYTGGWKKHQINSCDNSTINEYSVENTLKAQKWLFNHQHPINCTNKRFAIIRKFAWSGFGSTIHQIAWAFGKALADNRIAVYQTPGDWLYGSCHSNNPDCFFLPITNCSIPSIIDNNKTIYINANHGYWTEPIYPFIFRNQTFNWYRSQLVFYLLRYKSETLLYVQRSIIKSMKTSSIDFYRPFIAIYVRRSDKITGKEMDHAYPLKDYFQLFDGDARRANITNIYLNSEDNNVFKEFNELNKEKQNYYKLLKIKTKKNIIFTKLTAMSKKKRGEIVLDFLTDLFIEANAYLHAGTLTSNWCRLVDELRLTLGKTLMYYTPEKKYYLEK
ncbi:hypothetical protein I4U23_011011 [Adineta vaga]|nr:hypothetical protein I4U23_011011 [Adineta vaga]